MNASAAVCAIAILCSVDAATDDAITQTLRLKRANPADVMRALQVGPGVEELTLNFKQKSIRVRGARDAVLSVWEQIEEADSLPKTYRLDLTVTRETVDAEGKSTETQIRSSTFHVAEKRPMRTMATARDRCSYSVSVIVRPAKEGYVELDVRMQLLGDAGKVVCFTNRLLNAKLGAIERVGGITDSTDEVVKRYVQGGAGPRGFKNYTAYYVDIKPALVLEDPAAKGP